MNKLNEDDKYIQEPIRTVNGTFVNKKYCKIKQVGQGSYSKCYLVRTMDSNSEYVVKVIPRIKQQNLIRQKLVYEIKIHQLLSHPNVVHLDHWFENEEYQYIFMEYCNAGNLEQRLVRNGFFQQHQIQHYVRQIILSIQYIHSKNILHRDLKLCNFYLNRNGNLKLGDFGFCCQLSHQDQKKRQTCGTPNYIAPQVISGFGYSFSSDIWGIGVILYRMKYRQCPFEAQTVKSTLQNVKLCRYSFPKYPKISNNLKNLILKIFLLNYDDRITLEEMLQHEFFKDKKNANSNIQNKDEPKRGFSLSSLFFKQKEIKDKPTIAIKSNKKEVVQRSNSCDTFKQMKQIFKTKGNTTQTSTKNPMTMFTEENSFLSNKDGNKTVRNIIDLTFNNSLAESLKKEDRSSRLNKFITTQNNSKGLIKLHKEELLRNNFKKSSNHSTVLANMENLYYLPYEVQMEKNIAVVHYGPRTKQIIYDSKGRDVNSSYILHNTKSLVYSRDGYIVKEMPKVVKYIIDKKVQFQEVEEVQNEIIENVLQKIAKSWQLTGEGIILRYSKGIVAKMASQNSFYLSVPEPKTQLMYTRNKLEKCKVVEGIVLLKVYNGWINLQLK